MSDEQTAIIDKTNDKYPFCVVWTPIPILTWFFPILGHMGIALSNGVVQDFAASYTINENNMAFGKPTKYWQLRSSKANGGTSGWDHGITEASEIYKRRVHKLFWDNCHSYVATALNIMHYDNYTNWNMVKLALLVTVYSKYVGFQGFLKTWLPFFMIIALILKYYLWEYETCSIRVLVLLNKVYFLSFGMYPKMRFRRLRASLIPYDLLEFLFFVLLRFAVEMLFHRFDVLLNRPPQYTIYFKEMQIMYVSP